MIYQNWSTLIRLWRHFQQASKNHKPNAIKLEIDTKKEIKILKFANEISTSFNGERNQKTLENTYFWTIMKIRHYYSAIKKMNYWYIFNMDEPQKYYAKWKKLDTKSHMILILWNAQKRQIYRDRKWLNGCLGLVSEWKMTACVQEVSFWGDGNFLKLDCSDGCTTL